MRSTIGLRAWAYLSGVQLWFNKANGHCGVRAPWVGYEKLTWHAKEDMVRDLAHQEIWNPLTSSRLVVPALHLETIGFRQLWKDRPYREPARGTEFATGYDLYCSEDTLVQYGMVTRVATNTGLIWEWPFDLGLRIEDKSGLAFKNGVHNLGGRIDSDYKWDGALSTEGEFEIGVLQTCIIPGGFKQYRTGDKVAQLVITKNIWGDDRVGVDRVGGFGSTGTK